MKVKVSEATRHQLNWMVAKAEGHELMLFDALWRDNAARKGYPAHEVERHLQWQPQRGRQIIVEVRHLQLDQRNPEVLTPTRCARDIPDYCTDWSQGGPIIERELLFPEPLLDTNCALIRWRCRNWKGDGSDFYGPTPLISAMRCFCVSKLGEEVEVPEELK